MDKIKIEFEEGNCEYCYRVPTDFNWFEMSRHINKSQSILSEYIIYNDGRLFFDKFIIKENKKIVCDMSSEEKFNLKKVFIKKLILHEGITPITCAYAKYLKVNLEEAVQTYDTDTILFESDFKSNNADNNPYEILGISKGEYSKEELLKVVESKINNILDAYNTIVKQKLLKK